MYNVGDSVGGVSSKYNRDACAGESPSWPSALSTAALPVCLQGAAMPADRAEYNREWKRKNRKHVQEYNRKYREEHLEYYQEYNRKWHKEHREFCLARSRKWHRENREYDLEYKRKWRKLREKERAEYQRRYRQENSEKANEYARRYGQQNPEKIRLKTQRRQASVRNAEGTFVLAEWRAVKARFTHCPGCDREFTYKLRHTIDHIVPLSRGGRHSVENIQALCGSCNSRKHTKTMEEWKGGRNEQPIHRGY